MERAFAAIHARPAPIICGHVQMQQKHRDLVECRANSLQWAQENDIVAATIFSSAWLQLPCPCPLNGFLLGAQEAAFR